MISALFILDPSFKPLLSRNYRGDVPLSCISDLPGLIQIAQQNGNVAPPVLEDRGIHYMWMESGSVIFVAVSPQVSCNSMETLVFLSQLATVLTSYFEQLHAESVQDNFVLIYELLDEMMDFGVPQITDAGILKEYITVDAHKSLLGAVGDLVNAAVGEEGAAGNSGDIDVATHTTSRISWRPTGLQYKKNELFLDVVESVNLLYANDKVVRHEIQGRINVTSYLSGMPELRLGLNEKAMLEHKLAATGATTHKKPRSKTVEMEDVRFHQCVELSKFNVDRQMSFSPPDGKFELMSYRLNLANAEEDHAEEEEGQKVRNYAARNRPLILVTTDVEKKGNTRLLISVKLKSQFRKRSTANDVEVFVPVPPDATSPRFRATAGTVVYMPERNAIRWKIKQLQGGGKEFSMKAEISVSRTEEQGESLSELLHLNNTPQSQIPVQVTFEIPYYAMSGLQVRYLKVNEPTLKYRSLPWVRYITKNGDDYSYRLKKPREKESKKKDKTKAEPAAGDANTST
jgi:AP-1 complex subunit mu